MNSINWSASELKIHMTPVGKPLGRKPQTTSVFSEYGDSRPRLVQAIADMVDGDIVYLDACDEKGNAIQTIPIISWRNGDIGSYLANVTTFLETAMYKNLKIIAYGATRARWSLRIDSTVMASDCLDNMTDRGVVGDGRVRTSETVEANGLRTEF